MKNYSLPIIGLAMCLSTVLNAQDLKQPPHTPPSTAPSIASKVSMQQEAGKISINHADVSSLMQLPGIGLKKAEAIVAYRESQGEFTQAEELMNIKGIGKKLFTKLEPQVAL
jgi:competence protein ComEA